MLFILRKRLYIILVFIFSMSLLALYNCSVSSTNSNSSTVTTETDNFVPEVIRVSPGYGTVDIPGDARPVIEFSEPVDEFTVNFNSVKLQYRKSGDTGWSTDIADYSFDGNFVTLKPTLSSYPLEANTQYRITITTDVKDIAGNALASGFKWTFETNAEETDATAPLIISFTSDGAYLNTPIVLSFSDSIDFKTITEDSIVVKEQATGNTVEGTISYYNNKIFFKPYEYIVSGLVYNTTASGNLKNISGLSFIEETRSFTAGSAIEETAQSVTDNYPGADTTGISTRIVITVTFAEDANPDLINNTNFIITETVTGNTVNGNVFYSYEEKKAIFVPFSVLAVSTVYSVSISGSITDVYGNMMDDDYSWSFTTEE